MSGLHCFLGMVNFHSDHLPGLHVAAAPLYALVGGTKKKVRIAFGPAEKEAFTHIKSMLRKAVRLAVYDPAMAHLIITDASDVGMGGGFYQRTTPETPWQPVKFFSQTFSRSAKKWPAWRKELHGLLDACDRWHAWILESTTPVTCWTDNSVVQHIWTAKFGSECPNNFALGWALAICACNSRRMQKRISQR